MAMTRAVRSPSASSEEASESVKKAISVGPEDSDREIDALDNTSTKSLVTTEERPPLRSRHVSQAFSTISKRESSFSAANPIYDTQAIWKQDLSRKPNASLSMPLEVHVKKALDRYTRIVGQPLDFKRSTTSREFLSLVTNERLRYMPSQGSRVDKVFKMAEAFAKKFDTFSSATSSVDISSSESGATVLSSCKILTSVS